jgi:class 3 adenylate cyclase
MKRSFACRGLCRGERRLAEAEAELYEANIEERLRTSGMNVEAALEVEGIESHIQQPPAICFVDLTGYTRLTEERGDRFAADVAAQLASLVKDIARRRAGSPIRWLGDGGMFHFRDPAHAVEAGLDMVEQAPADRAAAGPDRAPRGTGDLPRRRRVRSDGQHSVATRIGRARRPGGRRRGGRKDGGRVQLPRYRPSDSQGRGGPDAAVSRRAMTRPDRLMVEVPTLRNG